MAFKNKNHNAIVIETSFYEFGNAKFHTKSGVNEYIRTISKYTYYIKFFVFNIIHSSREIPKLKEIKI